MSYIHNTITQLMASSPAQAEFYQAVEEVLESLEPLLESEARYRDSGIIERMVEPERQIMFRIPWVDDKGKVQVNKGYRIEFNSALGPYKGGLRFHPSVNAGIIKFLGFEQIFKNSLTGLEIGGGKGGANFNPKGRSDQEIMRFCQSFMNELYRHIGPTTDVPAGDMGVGAREIGYMFGQYKKLTNQFDGTLTGKGLTFGGSLIRKQATGYGLCYFTEEALKEIKNSSFKNKNVVISGSGNVAIYAAQKATDLGAKVVAMSDSSGYIYDKNGIDVDAIIQLKERDRKRIKEYISTHKNSIYKENASDIWAVKCDIALPCATQNELSLESAKHLTKNGVEMVAEGANMPCSLEAIEYFKEHKVIFAPGK